MAVICIFAAGELNAVMAIPAVAPKVIPAMVPAAVVAPLTLVFAALSRYSAAFRSRDIFLNCGDSKLSMVAY